MKVAIFSENINNTVDLIGAAKCFFGEAKVYPLVIGKVDDAEMIARLGAEKVYLLGELNGRIVDDFVPTIQGIINSISPNVFLCGSTVCDKAVAGRIAAGMHTSAFVNPKEISVVGDSVKASHVILGGNAIHTVYTETEPFIAILPSGNLDTMMECDQKKIAEIAEIDFVEPLYKISKIKSIEKPVGSSEVASAKRVVGVGRGFETKEDLAYAQSLAEVLDAALGFTRPVTEYEPPIVDGEPYIGISGAQIAPELYIAVAISGQVQHTIGVEGARCIVSINKDAEAPIFSYSDYGIVGDYKEILPEITRQLKE